MSAEIVNLRRVRKAKTRAEAAQKAAENRASFGVTRAERETTERALRSAERRHDGHRLQQDDADAP